jgi:hypothetical protein
MVKLIRIFGNGNAYIEKNDGTVEKFDLLLPLIKKLKDESQINDDTIIIGGFAGSVRVSDWYDNDCETITKDI